MRRTTGRLLVVAATGAVVVVGAALLLVGAAASAAIHEPTAAALEEIPPAYLGLYQEATAARCPGMPWSVLAAVGRVESRHGTLGGARLHPDGRVVPPIIGPPLDGTGGTRRILDTDDGRYDGDTVYDRAVGPMQFIPATWRAYGIDASGDGGADPHNAIDAIHTAAIYLCTHGADNPQRLRRALLAYNRSSDYVDLVLYHAARYGNEPDGTLPPSPDLITAVLNNPRLDIYAAGRGDIAAGRIDARVLQLLQAISQRHTLQITSLQSGHSRCVGGVDYPGCRVSHHWHGRAVDISRIDGQLVSRTNRDAYGLVYWLAALDGPLRPAEVGNPWPAFDFIPGFFSDSAHQGHIHLGWAPPSE